MKLKKGQVIYIDNQKYSVVNMIEYKEDTWIWQEYEIVSEMNTRKWLLVETNENGELEYYVYYTYNSNINMNEIGFMVGNERYSLYEKGKAVVQDYFGNADVDKYEVCEYYDYISEDNKKILSVEMWEDEVEKSQGSYLPKDRIKITEEIDNIKCYNEHRMISEKNLVALVSLEFFALLVGVFCINSGLFVNKSIEKYLKKQNVKYEYITSVTNNVNHKKAKVYKSTLGDLDATVKDIIDGVAEGITNTLEEDSAKNTKEDGIGLQTNKEYAYVYEEEDGIYIQVSSREYMSTSGGSTYHARHHSHYYGTYSSNQSSMMYDNYVHSARQSSISSRIISGGGTSSGK